VQVTGEINPDTGYVVDLKWLNDLIERTVLEKFDHKNLNLDTEEFKDLNPSAEHIAIVIYNILRGHLESTLDLKIRLYETELKAGSAISHNNYKTIEPRNNSIVFFDSRCKHEVMPVCCPSRQFEDGRFTLNGWLRREEN
jgi:6-pyruvoyl-tetrahydropterin synthase